MHQTTQISLREVAREAGVSTSTASQALRGSGRIAERTREKVRSAARRLGYQPNPLLASLAAKKFRGLPPSSNGTILIVTNDPRSWSFRLAHRIEECQTHCESLGYQFQRQEADGIGDLKEAAAQWKKDGVRGILITNSPTCHHLLRESWDDFAVVLLGGYFLEAHFHTVKSDVAHGLISLWDEGRSRGYRRIGMAMMTHNEPIMDDFVRGAVARYLMQQTDSPLPVHEGRLADRDAFLAWFEQYRPELVIGFPAVFPYWLNQAGYRVPADVACLHFGAFPGDAPAGWVEDDEKAYREAIEMLDRTIRSHQFGRPDCPAIVHIPGFWNEGGTCPPKASLSRPRRRPALADTA